MTKKILVVLSFALVFSANLRAQVTIGALTAPTAGAILDLNRGATGGLLLSNVALPDLSVIPANTFVNISTEQDTNQELVGMIVYNTDAATGVGVHFWDGDDWIKPCAPPAPGPITFSGPSCSVTASVASVTGATSYEWTLPPGLSISGTPDDATVTIIGTASTYSTGSITVRAVSSSCGAGTRRRSTQPVILLDAPAAPGTMNLSSTEICGIGTPFTASVADVEHAASYVWSLPNGLTGSSTTNSITISGDVAKTYSAGSISVQAVNECGAAGPSSLNTQAVTVVAIPATPGTISFSSTDICVGTTFTATVAAVPGATSYEWTLPAGLTVSGASNGATITISGAAGTYSAGSISVRALTSSCSSAPIGSAQDVTVIAIPATPGPITFSATTICGLGTTFTATVPNVAGVSYVWSLPNGLSGSSTSNSITIRGDVAKTYDAGSITVRAMISSCAGATSASTQDVTVVAIPATPGPITFSSTEICGVGTTFTAGVTPVSGATSYEWTLPAGLTVSGASNGATITISGAAGTYSAGSISVRALTSSCSSAPISSAQDVTVIAIPATPGPITFSGTSFCGASTFTASVTAVPGATSYVWTLPTGLSFVGAADGATITISGAVGTYPTGSISVRAVISSCDGAPIASAQEIVINARPAAPTGASSNAGASGTSIEFKATPRPDCTIDWYDALTGGAKIQTGVNSFSETLTSTKTYYAESRNNATGCVSTSRLAVTGIVILPVSGCASKPNVVITAANVAFAPNNIEHTRNGLTVSPPVIIVNLPARTTQFDGGGNNLYKADYRDHSVDTNLYGSFFSWCMVAQYANILCSNGWRVPTRAEFESYIDNWGSESPLIYGWKWGGYAIGREVRGFDSESHHWTSTQHSQYSSNTLLIRADGPSSTAYPQERKYGHFLRCVK